MAVRAAREGFECRAGESQWASRWHSFERTRRVGHAVGGETLAPIYDEARQAIFDHYRTTYGEDSRQYRDALPGKSGHTNGKFEPKVAEKVLTDLVTMEPRIRVIRIVCSAR
jgi:hypothetical protein